MNPANRSASIPSASSACVPISALVETLNALGLAATYHGPASLEINRLRPVDFCGPGDLTFIMSAADCRRTEKLIESLEAHKPSCVITSAQIPELAAAQIVTRHPLAAVAAIAETFFPKPLPKPGIHPTAAISPTAQIGDGVHIGAFVSIGDHCAIGDRCVIHPHVVIYPGVTIGKESVIHAGVVIREQVIMGEDCLIQPGVVLGGDGFGYFPDPTVGHRRVPHIGTLVLGDRVDFGANATVDRATLGETRIGDASKIDNLVQIGHNVQIGKRSILCGQVGISGSATIGNDVVLGGQAGVNNQVHVGDKIRVGAKSGITGSITKPGDYVGYPPVAASAFRRITAALNNLPELFKRVKRIERALNITSGDSASNSSRHSQEIE